MNILCLSKHLQEQQINYIKHLNSLSQINLKLYVIAPQLVFKRLFQKQLKERALFFIPEDVEVLSIDIPESIIKLPINKRGRAATDFLKDNSFDWSFQPDLILFSQQTVFDYTIKELFSNNPKLFMYAEFFTNSNLAKRKEWPLVEKYKKSSDLWIEKSTQDVENVDAILVPSNYAKSLWPQEYHQKIYTIFEGVDTYYLNPQRLDKISKYGKILRKLYPNKKFVAFISRSIESTRGFDLWMRAYVELRKRRDDIHFIVLGKDKGIQSGGGGARYHGIESFKKWSLEQLDLKEKELLDITWIDSLPFSDYLSLLKELDLVLYPTIGMFANWSFFQGMYMGIPVIASDNSYFPEVIEDGVNGYLCDPYDIDKMVSLSLNLLENENLTNAIRKKATETIKKSYSNTSSATLFMKLVNKICHETFPTAIDTDVKYYYLNSTTIANSINLYLAIDDLEKYNISKLFLFIKQMGFYKKYHFYIGSKLSNEIYDDVFLDELPNNIIVTFFPQNVTTSAMLNILMQRNPSDFYVILNPKIYIDNLQLFFIHLNQVFQEDFFDIAGNLRKFQTSDLDIVKLYDSSKQLQLNTMNIIKPEIILVKNSLLNKIGYFYESIDFESALVEYSVRAQLFNIDLVDVKDTITQLITTSSLFDSYSDKYESNRHIPHGYGVYYDHYFLNKRLEIKNILFINAYGYRESIHTLLDYFINATVYGISVLEDKKVDHTRCINKIINQDDRFALHEIGKSVSEGFDLIIDDGTHLMKDTQIALGVLFQYLAPNGTYVIESLHVCPTTKLIFAGGENKKRWFIGDEISTLEMLKILSEGDSLEIAKSYCSVGELNYLIENIKSCNIEMANRSEIAFISKKN